MFGSKKKQEAKRKYQECQEFLFEIVNELKELGIEMQKGEYTDSFYNDRDFFPHSIRLNIYGNVKDEVLGVVIDFSFRANSDFKRKLSQKVLEKFNLSYGLHNTLWHSELQSHKPSEIAQNIINAFECYDTLREKTRSIQKNISKQMDTKIEQLVKDFV